MDLLSDSMTSGYDPDGPDGGTPDYLSPSTIAQHQTPDARMFGPMPAVRANDLFDVEGSGDGLDPSVTRPARMGETLLEASGLAPRRTFGQRVRDFLGSSESGGLEEGEEEKPEQKEPQEPGEQYAARPEPAPQQSYAPVAQPAQLPEGPLGTHTVHGAGPDGQPIRTPGTRTLGTRYNLWGD